VSKPPKQKLKKIHNSVIGHYSSIDSAG